MSKGKAIIKKAGSPVAITLIAICMVALVSDYQFRWKNEQWKSALHSDGRLYYRFLPMIFINHHLDDPATNPEVVKCYIGTALFYAPFFAGAYLFSLMLHYPLDGYSKWFPVFISLGSLFYLLLGLYYLSRFLKRYSLADWIICTVISALALGTIGYYTVIAPGWSHMPAFFLVCLLLYHFKKIYASHSRLSMIIIIAGASFLFFIRPTDVLILLIAPFLAGCWNDFKSMVKRMLSEWKILVAALIIAALPLLCQVAVYKAATGHFFIWSYRSEGFDFFRPHIDEILFSFAKGLFIYSPVCFLALFGLYALYKRSRYQFAGMIAVIFINIYVLSSWWCWNYGCTFGTRAFIEMYPLFFLLLALLLDIKKIALRITVLLLILFFSFLSVFQMYQAVNGILDLDFKTDAKGYCSVFLRTDNKYSGRWYRYRVDESGDNIIRRVVRFNNMEKADTGWLNEHTRTNEKSWSGSFSSKVNSHQPYSTGLVQMWNELPYGRNVLIRLSGRFFIAGEGSGSYVSMSITSKDTFLYFEAFEMDKYVEKYGQWEQHVFEIYMPKLTEVGEKMHDKKMTFFLYNNSATDCFVDDLKIEFIEFRQMERVLDRSWESL